MCFQIYFKLLNALFLCNVFHPKQHINNNLICRWSIVFGPAWRCVEGVIHGQTQVDEPQDGFMAKWGHPIGELCCFVYVDNTDIHLMTRGLQGWPKIYVEVWHYDMFGRCELCKPFLFDHSQKRWIWILSRSLVSWRTHRRVRVLAASWICGRYCEM